MNDGYSSSVGYFIYHSKAYGKGTKVKLKSHVHIENLNTLYCKDDIYVFYDARANGICMFHWCDTVARPRWYQLVQINIINCDEDIEEIIEAVPVELISWQKKAIGNMASKEVVADIFGGVLMYIVVMLLALIFKDRWIIWIVATAIFGWWLLNQYRT